MARLPSLAAHACTALRVYALLRVRPISSSTRSASRSTASGRPRRLAAAAASVSASGDGSSCAIAPPRRSTRQILLLNAPSAARFGKLDRVLQLIVVDGMRQRHQDRRPAHHGKLGNRGGSRAADDEVRLGHLLGQVVEKARQVRAHAGWPGRRLRPASDPPGRHCCTMKRCSRMPSGSSGECGRHHVGKEPRTLAAAEHQQREGADRAEAA